MAINNVNGSVGGSATTSDDTVTTLVTYSANDDSAIAARSRVVARHSTSGATAVWDLRCAAKRFDGGGVVIVGDVETDFHKSDAVCENWQASFSPSGNNLLIVVKGGQGDGIDWSGQVDTREMYIT